MTKPNKLLPNVALSKGRKKPYRGRISIDGKYKLGPYRLTAEEAHKDAIEMRKLIPYKTQGPKHHPANLPKVTTSTQKLLKNIANSALKGTPFYGL